jgi:membrane protease YdiL (CAAX protease family)
MAASGNQPTRSDRARAIFPPTDIVRGWTPLLFVTCLVFVLWSLRATVFYFVDEAVDPDWRQAYGSAMKFLLMALPPFLYIWLIDKQSPWRALYLNEPPDAKARRAGIMWIVIATAIGAGGALFDGGTFAAIPAQGLACLWFMSMGIAFSATCEELLFRGFFLTQFAARTAFWKANLAQAILFSLIHAPHWFYMRGFTGAVLNDLAAVALIGWLLGFALKQSRSLWVCIVAHVLYNLIQAALRMPA